jgi:hypothetical protein
MGAPTFSNPTAATGEGPPVEAGATVEVTCKRFDPELASVEPEGYWYLIHTPPGAKISTWAPTHSGMGRRRAKKR